MYKIGNRIDREYLVSHVFTNGGMGVVYKVHRLDWDVDMAMKHPRSELFEDDSQCAGFIKECETWMDLGAHPNIVSCYYVKLVDGVPSVFMEYADGGSLADCIKMGKLYEGSPTEVLERIFDYAIQTARGLFHAHQKGYVHQDVKPANVLLTASGVAKVSDFGLSKAKGVLRKATLEAKGCSLVVSSGGWTPAYGSPEQARGLPLTKRTDVWSWAVMVLEMIHGGAPWRLGPYAGRVLGSFWPWQVFSTKVKSSQGLVKILRVCLEEKESLRPKDFDVIEGKLLALYTSTFKKEYARKLPATMLMAEATLGNRIASYAELESNGGDYYSKVFDCCDELHRVAPWALWGELNYAAYAYAHGRTISKILQVVENQLYRVNTEQEKAWILDLLLSLGITSPYNSMIKLLHIENNGELLKRVLGKHEFLRNQLNGVFKYEPTRHSVKERPDFHFYSCKYGVSENGKVHVKATCEERPNERVWGNDIFVKVIVSIDDKEYESSAYELPNESTIEYVTTDNRGIKISLWIHTQEGRYYQKVYGLEDGQLISYRCDFRKTEEWGRRNWGPFLGAYITGDARLMMVRHSSGVCSVWKNDRGDAGDGQNICAVRLPDYGLIPPETVLPRFRFEKGFEYGFSDETAYRLMRMLAQVYGQPRLPCHIVRPESSEVEMQRVQRISSLLERAEVVLKSSDKTPLINLLSRCLQVGVLPRTELLWARHQEVIKRGKAFPKTCWHANSIDEYWEASVCGLYSWEADEFQVVSLGNCARKFNLKACDVQMNSESYEFDRSEEMRTLQDARFITLAVCDNTDIIVAYCSGFHVAFIRRVSAWHYNREQKIFWEYKPSRKILAYDLIRANIWSKQTRDTISFKFDMPFDSPNGCLGFLNKENGSLRTVEVEGKIDFWSDDFSLDSPLALVVVTDRQVLALDWNGAQSAMVKGIERAVRFGRVCSVTNDGKMIFIRHDWSLRAFSLPTGEMKIVYAKDFAKWGSRGGLSLDVLCCTFSRSGRVAAWITDDNRLKVLDVTNRREIFEWKLEPGNYENMEFDQSERLLILSHDRKRFDAFQLFWEVEDDVSQKTATVNWC